MDLAKKVAVVVGGGSGMGRATAEDLDASFHPCDVTDETGSGMSLTMARDLGGLGIRVMTIAPSLFATGLLEGASDEIIATLTKDAAFPKRAGRPQEYAWLAEAIVKNPMLNGQTIRLDGGQRFAPR